MANVWLLTMTISITSITYQVLEIDDETNLA